MYIRALAASSRPGTLQMLVLYPVTVYRWPSSNGSCFRNFAGFRICPRGILCVTYTPSAVPPEHRTTMTRFFAVAAGPLQAAVVLLKRLTPGAATDVF